MKMEAKNYLRIVKLNFSRNMSREGGGFDGLSKSKNKFPLYLTTFV